MATKKIASVFENIVTWRNEASSFNKVKREVKDFRKEMEKMKGFGKPVSPSKPESPFVPSRQQKKQQDEHIKEGRKFFRQQNRFLAERERMTNDFLTTNRKITSENREGFRQQFLETKTAKEFRTVQKQINRLLLDQADAHRKNLRKLKEQNFAVKRLDSSVKQLAGSFISAFAVIEAGSSILRTGMEFEAVNKTLLAVSGSTEEAAQNMQFVREEARRLGLNLTQTGKAFGRMLAAGKGKIELEEIRNVFTAVSEAGVALGLSQDDMVGSLRAVQQILSKGKVTAEEMTQQLGDRLPFALKAMSRAAQDAGLIPKGTKESELEKHLFKLMEGGKVLAKDVIPAFGKQLRILAQGDLDAVTKALEENLQPALGRANLSLQEMQDAIFKGGLKQSVMFLLDGFNDLAQESTFLAKGLGGFLGGALFGLTFPIRLVSGAILDLKHIITDTFGIDNETEDWFFRVAGAAAGLAATIGGAIFAFKKLKQVKDVVTSSGTTIEKGGVDKGKGSIFNLRGHTPTKPLFVSIVGDTDVGGFTKDKTKTSKKPKKSAGLARGAIGAAALGAAGALFFGVLPESGKGESFSAESILGEDFALLDKPFLKQPPVTHVSPAIMASGFGAEQMFRKDPIKVDVTVIPDPELGNIMTVKAEEAQQNMISNARMSMGARGE